jgi:phage host-nuclease inhibitor protein Gam
MAKRIKQVGPAIKTREEMEGLVGRIAALTIERDELKAQMDGYILEVRERYDNQLGGIGKKLDELMALAQDWAEGNPEAFGAAKSIDMTHGTVGFRTGMPKLKTVAGYTWDLVKERILHLSAPYTRTEVSVNKEQLLADRETLGESGLRRLGVKVVQDESFFVDPKREKVEAAKQTAAPAERMAS